MSDVANNSQSTMSMFSDFHNVWVQRFPGSDLPAAWEEDVRANLAKHKERVSVLTEELEKEQFYVEYLENLLEDVEKRKLNGSEVEKAEEKLEKAELVAKEIVPAAKEIVKKEEPEKKVDSVPENEPDKGTATPYVTVIEVNGCERGVKNEAINNKDSAKNSPRKIPPRPPPKHFRKANCVPSVAIPEEQQKLTAQEIATADIPSNEQEKAEATVPPESQPVEPVYEPSKEQSVLQNVPPKTEAPKESPRLSRVPSAGARRIIQRKESKNSDDMPENSTTEPLYDTVAADVDAGDYVFLTEPPVTDTMQSGSSSNDLDGEGTFKSQTSVMSGQSGTTSSATTDTEGPTASPLPPEVDSPKSANYVNIEYFLNRHKPRRKVISELESRGESIESDEEIPPALLRACSSDKEDDEGHKSCDEVFEIDSGVYSSSVESTSAILCTPPGGKKWKEAETVEPNKEEAERMTMYKCIINSIIESEKIYVECLSVMLQYMKALKATLTSSQPVLTQDEFTVIFFKIPELHNLHQEFLMGLQDRTKNWDSKTIFGDHFKVMASQISVYGAFLQNYGKAIDTVRQCSQNNAQFADITKDIRLRLQGHPVSLEDLLHKPVARVQKNALVLHDLIKYTPELHPDHKSLKQALQMIQCFLNEFNMIQTENLFPSLDRAQRHLVKNSFIVELADGHRKLRHLFLFNDVIICAKYKASVKIEKFTFELKWYIPLADILVLEEPAVEPRESCPPNLVSLKSQASTMRDLIVRQESREDQRKNKMGSRAEKQRKKLADLEAQLVLASPNLIFRIGQRSGKTYTFFLSSEFERSQWVEAIQVLQGSHKLGSSTTNLNMYELQSWLTDCRKHLKTNMGSYLLQCSRDESLLVGDLHVLVVGLQGLLQPADLYICLEVDSYGHYFRKAKTKMVCNSTEPMWNEDFIVELEGSLNLRILLYEENQCQGTLLRGKATLELSRSWLDCSMLEQRISLQEFVLTLSLKFTPSEMTIRRVPTGKSSGLFGAKIAQVAKREKRSVPFIVTSCIREVEKRGMNEVGIYRVSGSASDVSRLKKAYESNSYEAEQMLKEVDIHSVTGILKLYLRELPEALFTDDLYPKYFEAFNKPEPEVRKKCYLQLFSSLPQVNQSIIVYLLEHMIKVNQHERHNKMSLHNLATVFGPTLLRPASKSSNNSHSDPLALGTADVMAQAGILYFFLHRRSRDEPIQGVLE